MTTSNLKFFGILFFNPIIRIANRISWRFGRPYKCSSDKVKPFLPHLKPGMLVVTRTEYLFGNLWIHGYWTHAGLVIPGNKVIEAVGRGIRESSFEQFFSDIDDFAIFNPVSAEPELIRYACDFAKKAVGLRYNFSFRRKRRTYYCSELIYLSFEKAVRKWRGATDYTEYGRPYWERKFIITPDWLVSTPLQWFRLPNTT